VLIPRKLLFGNPTKANAQLSPDGVHLAYVAPDANDVLQVWLRAARGDGEDRRLTDDRKRGIRVFFWTHDPGRLVYLQDADGDENWHLYAVDVETLAVSDLTPHPGIQAQPVRRSHRHPGQLLVALNLVDARKHDVYRVDLRSGVSELDTENPGDVVQWQADDELVVKAAVAMMGDGSSELRVRRGKDAPWKPVRRWGPDENGFVVGFSAEGNRLYLLSNKDAPAMRLVGLDLESDREEVIAADPQYDASEVLLHPTTRQVQAVGFTRERLSWQFLDGAVARDFEALAAIRPGDIRVTSADLADETWVVSFLTDDGPVFSHLYDRGSGVQTYLFSNRPELEGLPLARMRPVSFRARDGLNLHGYLTLPEGPEPGTKLPAVLLVHGGPWGRDVWGLQPEVQWLANRGYAVLQVNFRGSAGYGRDFLNAGNREWGARMHDDLIDGVKWLVEQGKVDPQRIGIMGGSYGGYAALAGLTFTPEAFAAGVDIVGPSNLNTLLRSIPPYWAPMLGIFRHRVGDPDTEEQFLRSRSPVFFAERIRRPLLVAQGANDPRVKEAESEQIVRAMRERGLPVEYLVYTDEGHGFARPENRLHFYGVAEQFLARHLGGQAEPLSEVPGHSAVFK
jgi:dipeptidyl aminopeptidase/acylaminoacyl peptidase